MTRDNVVSMNNYQRIARQLSADLRDIIQSPCSAIANHFQRHFVHDHSPLRGRSSSKRIPRAIPVKLSLGLLEPQGMIGNCVQILDDIHCYS